MGPAPGSALPHLPLGALPEKQERDLQSKQRTEGRCLWHRSVEGLKRELTPSALPLGGIRRLCAGGVGDMFLGSQEVPKGQRKEGGRMQLCPADPLARVPPGRLCIPGTAHSLHMVVSGGWWLCLGDLRLLPPPWEGEKAELSGNYRQPCTRPAQTSSHYSRPGSAWFSRGMGRAQQRQLGGDEWGRDSQLSQALSPGLFRRYRPS